MKTGKTLSELAAEIERQYKTKKDYVADLSAVKMVPATAAPGGQALALSNNLGFGITPIAHEQIAEHTGIPKKYYDRMQQQAPELREGRRVSCERLGADRGSGLIHHRRGGKFLPPRTLSGAKRIWHPRSSSPTALASTFKARTGSSPGTTGFTSSGTGCSAR